MELKVIEPERLVIDSREVAKMIDKQHKDLLESIRQYINYLTGGKFRSSEFFIENNYQDSKNETRPCYLITKKGCDMIANKLIGEKGVLFTAAYVTKFEEMQTQLQPSYMIADPIKRAEKWIEEQKEKQALTHELEHKDDVIITLTKDVTLATKQQRINDIVRHTNNFKKIQERWLLLYSEFDKAMHIDTKKRYENALTNNETKANNRLTFICNTLNLTDELYRVCVKLFEADARQMFNNILDLI